MGGHVTSKHLDGDDEGVLEQVAVGGGAAVLVCEFSASYVK